MRQKRNIRLQINPVAGRENEHEDQAPVEDADGYVREIAYRTVYSRQPDDAKVVAALVKERVEEMYEKA